jgi:hypothetical protein
MHSPQQAHSDMHIKGGLLRARFLFIVLNHGADVWAKIVAGLPQTDREALDEIEIDNWYSLATLDRVDSAIADELDGDREEVFTALGEFSATSSLSGPFSSLLNSDIHGFLTQTALIHRSYQDFGDATYEVLSDNSGLLKIDYEDAPPISYCTSGTAYFRRAIELCGAQNARITHTRCAGRGDVVCEFYATWQ